MTSAEVFGGAMALERMLLLAASLEVSEAL